LSALGRATGLRHGMARYRRKKNRPDDSFHSQPRFPVARAAAIVPLPPLISVAVCATAPIKRFPEFNLWLKNQPDRRRRRLQGYKPA
jgi:hypothetical protein